MSNVIKFPNRSTGENEPIETDFRELDREQSTRITKAYQAAGGPSATR
jgi:hypothetical protein